MNGDDVYNYSTDEESGISLLNIIGFGNDLPAFTVTPDYEDTTCEIKASDKTILPHPEDYEETLDGKILKIFLNDNVKAVPTEHPITIRNAVDALVHEGLLRRVQGKGVFVVGKKSELSIEEHGGFVGDSFTKDSRLTIKELQKTTREAGNLYANLFDLPNVEDEIYYIRQMHYINSVETSIEEFFIPVGVIPSLENINSSVFTFRDILSFYGIRLKKMNQALRIIKGSAKTRKMLNVPEGVAIMHLECDFYNEDNVIIAHSISNIRSDMQSFTVSMH